MYSYGVSRANPALVNTLAKWKKLELTEIGNFISVRSAWVNRLDIVSYKSVYFITSSEFNAYQMWVKLVYFSTVKKYRIFSLVTNTIYIFTVEWNRTVAKHGFLGNFVTGIFFT